MFEGKADKILYGGDYNPEQWPEEVWKEDMALFQKANIDIVTLNVFSWALLQRSEEEYHFEPDKVYLFKIHRDRLAQFKQLLQQKK